METIRVTKEFSFEMAHTLTGYDGLCREIHGHSYRLLVTVSGSPSTDARDPKCGMVMDFGILKQIVNEKIIHRYDHSLMIRNTEANGELIETLRKHFLKVESVEWQPTCENIIRHFVNLIGSALPEGVTLQTLRLHETATSYAEWHRSDNP